MKYVVNVQDKEPDVDPRSLRARVKDRDKAVLRDTYFLVDYQENGGPAQGIRMGIPLYIPQEQLQVIPMTMKKYTLSFQARA